MVKYAKPNQKPDFVRNNREFVLTVIVITEFDCTYKRQDWKVQQWWVSVYSEGDILQNVEPRKADC